MNVKCEIQAYSVNITDDKLIVESDGCSGRYVTLKINEEKITVSGDALIAAVQNCMHT